MRLQKFLPKIATSFPLLRARSSEDRSTWILRSLATCFPICSPTLRSQRCPSMPVRGQGPFNAGLQAHMLGNTPNCSKLGFGTRSKHGSPSGILPNFSAPAMCHRTPSRFLASTCLTESTTLLTNTKQGSLARWMRWATLRCHRVRSFPWTTASRDVLLRRISNFTILYGVLALTLWTALRNLWALERVFASLTSTPWTCSSSTNTIPMMPITLTRGASGCLYLARTKTSPSSPAYWSAHQRVERRRLLFVAKMWRS
mmetsp:Transcript_64738/g.156468  ORF Transcript_64738/g.156468 Transcript_64738/m.156468 type:complete len:257 (+) Transcript_64738:360-1130(+)